jgi:hypothetical protein
MQATVGDRIHVHGAHVDDHQREGRIVEVRGKDGAPPYLVHWFDTDHDALVFPGPDAQIHPAPAGDTTS